MEQLHGSTGLDASGRAGERVSLRLQFDHIGACRPIGVGLDHVVDEAVEDKRLNVERLGLFRRQVHHVVSHHFLHDEQHAQAGYSVAPTSQGLEGLLKREGSRVWGDYTMHATFKHVQFNLRQ